MSINIKKTRQLGISIGTASNRLKKMVMFKLLQDLNRNICFRCSDPIENYEFLSIDHKKPWLDGDISLFWDIENIAFSHLSCNIGCRRVKNKIEYPTGKKWCWRCKMFKPLSEFMPSAAVKRHRACKICVREMQRSRRK